MIRHLLVCAAACALGAGCTSRPATAAAGAPTQLIAAHPTVEAPAVVSLPSPTPTPTQRKVVTVPPPLNMTTPSSPWSLPHDADIRRAGMIARQARARATQVASTSTYINAVAVYDYVPGEVYQIYTSPDYVTTIALKPGEKLISKVAGDTTRWIIGDTITGDGANATVLVVLKPVRPNLRTNLMLSTNQRVYQIDLIALSGNQYQNAISWNYPQDAAREAEAKAAAMTAQAQQTELTGVAIEDLNDNYTVKTVQGGPPDWMPKHIFDDGRKTYIEFPPNLGTTTAPPLFVMSHDDKADLVNYRVRGHFYIVDRLFDRAQLRVGENPQVIVELRREKKQVQTAGEPVELLRR